MTEHTIPTLDQDDLPLAGVRVLDFAQFLAGPVAAMRLADLGADVIKIERPQGGDACRALAIRDQKFAGDSLLFHTFNRGKRSYAANLKDAEDLKDVKALIRSADVLIHNFRPGIMERLGLGFDQIREINPTLVYASVTGYGNKGPWRDKPGQDLLVQSLSGMAWLSGNGDDDPVPVGFPLVDIATAGNLVQGILAQLFRRERTGRGGLVEVDLMSSAIDLQIEHLTSHLNGDGSLPERSATSNANVYGAAPYGIYQLDGGYLAIAMTPISALAKLLEISALDQFSQDEAFSKREEIKAILTEALAGHNLDDVLGVLEAADIWCAKVMNWTEFTGSDGFQALDPITQVSGPDGSTAIVTRCPIRLDGAVPRNGRGAPALGADNPQIRNELLPG
ncbi:CoA transferase [Paracoccus sp. Z330]|uniref:CoA transferase n=1 Tax=Paracoccus onchidii TaxID=3017813 RepID=A0ABT4ZJ11_9RHOB|nr:CoA transferase [Paracoccus onchidii]MDB6179277.1 CoA transferase [Paracoccus onchidii]